MQEGAEFFDHQSVQSFKAVGRVKRVLFAFWNDLSSDLCLQVIEVPVNNLDAVVSGFPQGVLNISLLIVNLPYDIILSKSYPYQPFFVLFDELNLVSYSLIVPAVGILDILVSGRSASLDMILSVFAYASGAQSNKAGSCMRSQGTIGAKIGDRITRMFRTVQFVVVHLFFFQK